MKLSHNIEGERITVTIRDEIDGGACECLSHYWDRFVSDPFVEVRLEMRDVDAIDSEGVARMVELIRRNLADGARVLLYAPPQTLAHTLYKVGMLSETERLILEQPRSEEPYAG